MRFAVAVLAFSIVVLLGCTVESDEASPSPTPTPIYVTIYVTVTPSPTPIPTRTPIPTPTYTPTATPFPELKDPSLSSIWGDVELFSLLYALKDRPIETSLAYEQKHVAIRQRLACCISGNVRSNTIWLSGRYAHNEPIEREFTVVCSIPDVQDRHLPILAHLQALIKQRELGESLDYVQVTGTIRSMSLRYGGMNLTIGLDDCEVTAVGNSIVG